MEESVLKHYLDYSSFTYPGLYESYLKNELPDEIEEIGFLVRKQFVHRSSLVSGNTGTNSDLQYGDLTRVPWYRQSEDDLFPTAVAMLAELFRRDQKGLTLERNPEDKLILTCRFTALLVAAILKAKGIPARVRSGFASYFVVEGLPVGKNEDHWINQYWNEKESRWATIDVDGSLHDYTGINFYDIPEGVFDFSADAWLKVRRGETDENYFRNGDGTEGLVVIAWELFYDFHCLMNDEVIYLHIPEFVSFGEFKAISGEQLKDIDELAKLMQNPDDNFVQLKHIWDTNKQFRLMKGGLL